MPASERERDRASEVWHLRPRFGFGHACAFASLHALLFALSFPPFDWWFLAFLAPAPLAWVALRSPRTSHAIAVVISTQFLMWLWLLHWIIPVTAVGYPVLSLYQSVYPAIFVWIIRRVERHRTLRHWPKMLVVPIVWTGVEFFRGRIAFDGYPWYLLAHPLIEWPLIVQTSDLFGAYLISFFAVMPSGLLVGIANHTRQMIDSPTVVDPRGRVRFLMIVVAGLVLTIAANLVYGAWRMSQSDVLSSGPNILAIQTNLSQNNKVAWKPEQQEQDFLAFCDQTINALKDTRASGRDIDLILWPETMLPGFGLEPQTIAFLVNGQYRAGVFAPAIQELQRELGMPMLVGSGAYFGLRVVDNGWVDDLQYNSAYLVAGELPYQRYDKSFLTPFGETMPYISKWKWLEQKLLALGAGGMKFDLASNPDIALIKLSFDAHHPSSTQSSIVNRQSTINLATPICFEDTVPQLCRRMCYDAGLKRADMLVNLSNDGWFNTSHADRKLHAQIARFRCIENRVPMVRCVNTGLSVSIDSCGRLVGAVGVGPGQYGESRQAGALYAQPQLDARQTLYGRIGDVFPAACLIITILFLGWTYLPGSRASSP